jgi:hypothetical protein
MRGDLRKAILRVGAGRQIEMRAEAYDKMKFSRFGLGSRHARLPRRSGAMVAAHGATGPGGAVGGSVILPAIARRAVAGR